MRRMMRSAGGFLATAVVALAGLHEAEAQTRKKPVLRKKTTVVRPAAPAVKLYTVEAGKRIRVRINESLSSKTAAVGDRFTVTVRETVFSTSGATLIPEGSLITGRVDAVAKAQKGGKPGTLDVSFIQVELPNGSKRAINGSLTELVSDDAKSDDEGTARGDKMKHRKVIFYGGGAAGGALLGAAIGGGKGAIIGGLLGAGGGFLGERYTKGEEAEVVSGTEFGIHINRAFTLPKFAEAEPKP